MEAVREMSPADTKRINGITIREKEEEIWGWASDSFTQLESHFEMRFFSIIWLAAVQNYLIWTISGITSEQMLRRRRRYEKNNVILCWLYSLIEFLCPQDSSNNWSGRLMMCFSHGSFVENEIFFLSSLGESISLIPTRKARTTF